jgi:hypothetical protein
MMNKWIDTKDALPPENEHVIICFMNPKLVKPAYLHNGYFRANEIVRYKTPDYWMPLPDPPEPPYKYDDTFSKYKGSV